MKNALVGDGCYVDGTVIHSILSQNVHVQEGTTIEDSFIMSGTFIGENVTIKNAIIGENAKIGDNVEIIGEDEVAVIGHGEIKGENKNEQ